jgi:hypothetical protein
MVGKKTVNIGISLNVVAVNANAGMSSEDELDECREGYFIGEGRTDR